jgi:hypothetical protein
MAWEPLLTFPLTSSRYYHHSSLLAGDMKHGLTALIEDTVVALPSGAIASWKFQAVSRNFSECDTTEDVIVISDQVKRAGCRGPTERRRASANARSRAGSPRPGPALVRPRPRFRTERSDLRTIALGHVQDREDAVCRSPA